MKRRLSIGVYPNCFTEVLGGSERLCHGLVCNLAQRGHRVVLFCNNAVSEKTVLPLPNEVEVQFITIRNPSNAQMQAAKNKFLAADLDVFLAFNSSCQQLFLTTALLGTGIPYIYSELVEPVYVRKFWSEAGRTAAMSGADRIHMLRAPGNGDLPPHLKERVRVIPSPAPEIPKSLRADPEGKLLLSLGGQNDNKQIPLLIKAFERLHARFPDWKCEVWGVGPAGRHCEALAAQSPARANLAYKGFADDALRTLARGSVYCIPSRFEGMPLTLLEAMTLGLPAVGFRECAGVANLVRHGSTGLLAPEMTVESLAAQLAALMENKELRAALGRQARLAAEEYAPGHIHGQWEELLYETAALRGHTQMDDFASEPFASRARLSAAARREYLMRDFGQPMPGTVAFWRRKAGNLLRSARAFLRKDDARPELPPLRLLPQDLLPVYESARRNHADLARSILHLRRETLPELNGNLELPGDHVASGRHHAMLARYFWAAQTFPSGSRVCALEAGPGWGAAILARTTESVVCVERDPACRDIAARLWPELRTNWHTDDALTFLRQTPDESFDGITFMETPKHMPPESIRPLFAEIARCLRRGGIVICSSAALSRERVSIDDASAPQDSAPWQNELLALTETLFADRRFLGLTLFMGRKSL